MPDHTFRNIFPNIQPEYPLEQLKATTSCPVTSYTEEEANLHLATISFQGAAESDEMFPEPALLHSK